MLAILFDETKCVGCNECAKACVNDNHLPREIPAPTSMGDGLSGRRWMSILKVPGARGYVKRQCLHCLHPACEAACLVGAMKKTENGPVVYDAAKCIGCRYCMLACPVGIPRYQWEKALPYIQKCDMCYDRLDQGKQCACVEACKYGALQLGPREEMLEKAHALIRSNPGKYLDHVYGEKELGGVCVLYITNAPLEKVLKFDEVVKAQAIPDLTWPVISKTPVVALAALSSLVGVWWITERRMKVEQEQEEARLSSVRAMEKKDAGEEGKSDE